MSSLSSIAIRGAQREDIEAIIGIDAQVYSSPWSETMLMQQINGSDRVHVVAEHSEELVGHAGVMFLAGVAHVSTIAVHPDHQRRGIGRRLLLSLFSATVAQECEALTLEVRSGNDAAIALYRSFGLAPAGIRRGYYADDGDDALVLWSPVLTGDYADRITAMIAADLDVVDQVGERKGTIR